MANPWEAYQVTTGPTQKEQKTTAEIGRTQAGTAAALGNLQVSQRRQELAERKYQDALKANYNATITTRNSQYTNLNVLLNAIQLAKQNVQQGGTGVASVLGRLPIGGLPAAQLQRSVDPIKYMLVNNWINTAKAASGKGTTGIGRILAGELPIFQGLLGSLSTASTPEELIRVLDRIAYAAKYQYAEVNGHGADLTAEADPKVRDATMSAYGINDPTHTVAPPPPDVGIRTAPETPEGKAVPLSGMTRPMTKEDVPSYVSAAMDNAMDMLNTKNATPPQVMDYLRNTLKGTPYEAQYAGPSTQQQIESWFNYRLQNPEKMASWTPKGDVPRTGEAGDLYKQDIYGKLATSAPGAYFQGAASGLTSNWLPEILQLTGQGPAETRRAELASVQRESPVPYNVGDISGQIMQQELLNLKLPPVITMPLSSAISGAGASPEDRTMGAVMGGTLGTIGAAGGTVGGKAAEALGTGLRDIPASALFLGQKGVDVTIGDLLGKYPQMAEQFLAKTPLVGAMVRRRQAATIPDFNAAAFDTALAPIGATTNGAIGFEGRDAAKAAVSDHLNSAMAGLDADVPGTLRQKVVDTIEMLKSAETDDTRAAAAALERNVLPRVTGDSRLTADSAKLFLDATKKIAYGTSGPPSTPVQQIVRPAIQDLDNALFDTIEQAAGGMDDAAKARIIQQINNSGLPEADKALMIQNTQNAPDFSGVKQRLRDGKDAYRNLSILDGAIADSQATKGVFSQDTFLNNAKDNIITYGGEGAAATADAHPMLQLAREGKQLGASKPTFGGAAGELLPYVLASGAAGAEAAADAEARKQAHADQGPSAGADFTGALLRNLAIAAVPTAATGIVYSKAAQDALRERLMQRYTAELAPKLSLPARVAVRGMPYAGQAAGQYLGVGVPQNAPLPTYKDIPFNLPLASQGNIPAAESEDDQSDGVGTAPVGDQDNTPPATANEARGGYIRKKLAARR